MNMNKITSVTFHTTGEGQRLTYTYSVIDEDTGTLVSDNNRKNMIVMDTKNNKEILSCINKIYEYVAQKNE